MLRKIQSAISRIGNCARGASSPLTNVSDSQNLAAVQMFQLEDRVLYSASPFVPPLEPVADIDPDQGLLETSSVDFPWAATSDLSVSELNWAIDQVDEFGVSSELIIVDTSVDGYEQLIDGIELNSGQEFEILYLDSATDSLEKITDALANFSDLDAIHVVTHGDQAQVRLGQSVLSIDSLVGHAGDLARWGNALSPEGDLLFYGCDLASTQEGESLVEAISALTGADVAASDDLTGHASLGGDWNLEISTGVIETALPFTELARETWVGVLAVVANDDGYSTDENTVLNESAPGVLSNDTDGGAISTVAFGATLNYDAALDTNDNGIWEDSTGVANFDWVLDGSVTYDDSLVGAPEGITAAFVFDGTAGGTISDSLSDLPGDPTDGSLTFEIWYRPDTPSDNRGVLFDTGDGNNGLNLRLYQNGGDSYVEYVVGTTPTKYIVVTANITTEMNSGEFIQIAASFDASSSTAELFVNGTSVGSDTDVGVSSWSNNSDGMGIGQADFGLKQFNDPHFNAFKGEIGIFRFYESALMPGQIQDNYDAIINGVTVTAFDATSTSGATVNVNANGSFSYNPGTLFDYLKDGESVVDTFTYTAENSVGSSDSATVSITVNGITEAPTGITSSFNINENIDTSSGTSVGTLITTDEDAGETFTYTIEGGADQLLFSIGGALSDELVLTDGTLDFETQSSYSVTVRVTDSGGLTYDEAVTVTVNDLNESPTAIAPTSFNINENTDTSSGTSVGTLSTTDEDAGDTFTYSIQGGADLAKFSIGGALTNELVLTDGTLDFETQSSYSVIVRVTDSGGLTYDEAITVTVNDLNESPTAIAPNSFNINENTDTSSGTSVGTLSTTDEDAGDTFTYSIQGGADQLSFSIGGALNDELILTDGTLDFESQSSYSVTIRVIDSGGLTYDEAITVNVNDLNESPTAIAPTSFNINENTDTSSGTSVGTLSTTDEDAGETFSYAIQGGADIAKFSIGGALNDELILTDGTLNFESQPSYSVIVRVTDSGGLTYDESITVNVNDLNETPTAIAPNSFNINEYIDTSSGTSVGTLVTNDEDAGETFTYSIQGGADQLSFSIGGALSDELILTDGILNYDTQSTFNVIVRVTDSGGLTHDEAITVNVVASNQFWFTTIDSGNAGGETWNNTDAVQFGGTGMTLEPTTGTTAGTISFTGFSAPAEIRGLHMVRTNINVGGMSLNPGDLLLALDTNGLPGNEYDFGTFTADRHDIIRFRPDTPGNYASGSYEMFLDEAVHDNGPSYYNVHAFSLIEQQVTVGGTVLNAGNIVVAHSGPSLHDDLYVFSVSNAGFTTTATSDTSMLLRGSDGPTDTAFGGQQIQGLSVLDRDLNIGDTFLSAGSILVALNTSSSESVGDNNVSVQGEDIFYLTVSQTEPTASIANATLLVEGVDLGLDSAGNEENINGLTLVGSVLNSIQPPTDIAPDSFNVNENTDTSGGISVGTLTTTDSDIGDTFTYSIESGADGTLFAIGGAGNDELILDDGVLDFETKSSYTVNIRVTDSGGLTYDESITVNVNNLNDSPTAIAPNSFNINENTDTSSGTSVGTLTTTDEDAGDSFTYSIQGGADQLLFSIGGALNDELILTDGTLNFESQGSYSVIVRVTDSGGLTYDESITVNVNDLNETPTAIAPNSFNINENTDTSSGTSVGTLVTTDEDAGDSFTYSIQGGADQASFSIGGALNDELILTAGTLDFESQSNYSVTVRVTDSGGLTYDESITVNVNNLNDSPTAIAPNSFNINENTDTSSGTSVGILTTTDEDAGDSFAYSIQGGADQASFSIGGALNDELILTDGTLNFESQASYSVIVRVTDSGGLTYDESITVNVNDLNDSPTAIAPNSFNINENTDTSSGTSVGTLTTTDEDAGDSFTYSIQGGADQASFSIGGALNDELILTAGTLDFESQPNYSVTVRVTDSGGLTYDESITVNVNNLNDSPTAIAPNSFNINENTDTSSGTSVGTLTTTDEDAGDSFAYSIQGGADQASFSIGGALSDELILTDGTLDFETQSSYFVTIRVTDSGGLSYDESITVNVNDLNESPTAIAPNSFNINENTDTSSGTSVGTLVTTDEDAGDSFTYSIQGGADQASFSIGGALSDELILTDGTLDFETQSSYFVTIRVTDSGGLSYDESITVNVNDLNESPTDVSPNGGLLANGTDTTGGVSVATLTTTDPDLGDTFTYSVLPGGDAANFTIGGAGDELMIDDGILNLFFKPIYTVNLRTTDSSGNTFDDSFTLFVTFSNFAPTDISPDVFFIDENTDSSGGTSLGSLTATDPNIFDSFTYTILPGADVGLFSIGGAGGDELILSDGILDFEGTSMYTVNVRVTDSGGLTYDEAVTVNVNDLNEAPTAIAPNIFNIDENIDTSSGISVGTLATTDEDAGETFTYSIQGGADQLSFSIGGALNDELILNDGILDFETKPTYSVTVRVTDSAGNTHDEAMMIDVNDQNEAPTAITPTNFNINENVDTSSGTSLGTLAATDFDPGETFTYTLVGGTDQLLFSIGGGLNNELILSAGILNFESQSNFDVTLRVTDSFGNTFDQAISVDVNDLNESPTAITPAIYNVNENVDASSGITLGDLIASDEDAGETFVYSIIGGVDQANFSIGGLDADELVFTASSLNFEAKSNYHVTVRATDSAGNNYDENLVVNINDLNESPTAITPNLFEVNENIDASSGISLGIVNAIDPDNVDSFSFTIQGGADQAKFSIGGVSGNELILTESTIDFDIQSSYTVIVRVIDSGGNIYDQSVNVNVVEFPIGNQPNDGDDDDIGDEEPNEDNGEDESESGNEKPRDNPGGDTGNQLDVPPESAPPQIVNVVFSNPVNAFEPEEELDSETDSVLSLSTFAFATGNNRNNTTRGATAAETALISESYVTNALLTAMNQLQVEVDQEDLLNQILVGSTLTASASITAGYVIWLIRGGVLLSSALSSLPAWRMVDPLPVLSYFSESLDDEDDDSLEALVRKSNSSYEEAVVG